MFWTKRLRLIGAASLLLLAAGPLPSMRSSSSIREQTLPNPPSTASPQSSLEVPKHAAAELSVIIDPSHGGEDIGAALPGKMAEKDLTLTLARELRRQLEERGVHARLLRDSDIDLPLERRAEAANQEHAWLYVALHAGPPGKGVRVYWSAKTTEQTSARPVIPEWERAQSTISDISRSLANGVADQIRKRDVSTSLLSAPLRPLNNVLAPAIAIEWAPSPADLKPGQTEKAAAGLAAVLAAAIAPIRGPMGARP